MKLYTAPTLATQLSSSLGTDYLLYAFTGVVPNDVYGIPFDFNDVRVLSNEASAICKVQSSFYDEGSLRFLNKLSYKRPFGHKFNKIVNRLQVYPKHVTLSDDYENLSAEEASVNFSAGYTFNHTQRMLEDSFTEYDFGKAVSIDTLHMSAHSSSSYHVGNFELWREVLGVDDVPEWVLCEAFTIELNAVKSYVALATLSAEYTAQKFRIIAKGETSSTKYSSGTEFFATTEPVEANTPEDYTWFILRSIKMDKLFGTEDPIILGDAGGPNSGKEVALSHYKSTSGEEIKLLNFKLKSKVIGESNA